MLTPPGPMSSPTMMSTMPARIPPRISVRMPAITKTAAMIHRRVHAAPEAARSASIMRSSSLPVAVRSACARPSSGLPVPLFRTQLSLRPSHTQQFLEQGPVVDHGLPEILRFAVAPIPLAGPRDAMGRPVVLHHPGVVDGDVGGPRL